jgi:predicted transcriptional regulator/beta-lactamase regulating signal transducer with metallopeptidase domain
MDVTLTGRELEIMTILWNLGSGTVNQVRDQLPDDLAYTTVLSLIRTMEEKGLVRHEAEGRAYRYFPLIQEKTVRRSALKQLVETVFQGAPRIAVDPAGERSAIERRGPAPHPPADRRTPSGRGLMLAPWLLYASALGALLGIMALLMERIARWRAKPARWIWLAAIVAIVMIPAGLSFRPGSPGITRTPHASGAVRFDQSPELPRAIDAPLLILWLLASTLLASRIVGTAISLRRRRNRWLPATLGGHSILVADQLGPAVIGWRRLTTVIPRWALSLDEGSRALILQHEAEHARSGDPYLRSAALVALVLMPWNPAIWWAMRRLRLAVEIDCDQRVLGRGVDAHHYATLLLAVGERMSRIPFAWATALGGSRSFS